MIHTHYEHFQRINAMYKHKYNKIRIRISAEIFLVLTRLSTNFGSVVIKVSLLIMCQRFMTFFLSRKVSGKLGQNQKYLSRNSYPYFIILITLQAQLLFSPSITSSSLLKIMINNLNQSVKRGRSIIIKLYMHGRSIIHSVYYLCT